MRWPTSSAACAILSDSPLPAGSPATDPAPRDARPGLRVVLLGPKRGANVGAACRAIKNMGAGELVVVGGDYDRDEASRTAVHAGDVFDSRREAATFEEAVATSNMVIGTTSRERPWSIPVEEIGDVLADADARGLAASGIALVFGPEDRGLSNEELARCHRLAFVPTADEYSSLNLAQAVVVCLYEWRQTSRRSRVGGARSGVGGAPSRVVGERSRAAVASDDAPSADARAQSEALADLRRVLEEIGFLDGDQGDRVMATICSMLTRGGLDEREVSILRGMARQIRWAARRHCGAKGGTRGNE